MDDWVKDLDMLLVIFGAGASFDSVYPWDMPGQHFAPSVRGDGSSHVGLRDWNHPDRPPLADGLIDLRDRFGRALDEYEACRALVMHLRRILEAQDRIDIEAELERIQTLAEKEPHRVRQLAAFRFYLREIISEVTDQWWVTARGATNYGRLLDRIESWRSRTGQRVRLVTFNYDTMLERAALDVLGFDIKGIESFISHDEYLIAKPHGSVDWGRFIDSPWSPTRNERASVEAQIIQSAASLTLSDDYIWLGTTGDYMRDARPLMPAIAIPTISKSDFECPKDHMNALEQDLHEVDRILVVGWRATEQHFLEFLRGRLKNPMRVVAVVNGGTDQARETANRLEAATQLPSGCFIATDLSFSTLLNGKENGEAVLSELFSPGT